MKKIRIFAALLFSQLAVISCKKDKKKPSETAITATNDSVKTPKATEEKIDYKNFNIYSVTVISSGQKGALSDIFISVSDIYTDPQPIQKEALSNQKNVSPEQLQYIELDSKHRSKILNGLHLTENDSLYLYNYQFNKLEKLPLNKLKAVAYLDFYSMEGEEVDGTSYMVGFQIEAHKEPDIRNKYENAVAYFGNKNPFIENKMKPVQWKKASVDISKKYFTSSKLTPGDTYQAKYEDLTYYLQDYLQDEMVQERKLVVVNDRNEKTFAKTMTTAGSDGAEFYPLNGISNDESNTSQWTGYLFKGKPPVIFGFMAQSFGCPSITFLDKNQKDFTINCDNRH
jgi:hypothetical protein